MGRAIPSMRLRTIRGSRDVFARRSVSCTSFPTAGSSKCAGMTCARAYSRPLGAKSEKDKDDNEPLGSEAFFGIVTVRKHLVAVCVDGIYRFAPSGARLH